MNTKLELKEFNELRHRIATAVAALQAIPRSADMSQEVVRGLDLMTQDGLRIKEVLDAASRERELPLAFLSEVDNWGARAEEVTVSVDLS